MRPTSIEPSSRAATSLGALIAFDHSAVTEPQGTPIRHGDHPEPDPLGSSPATLTDGAKTISYVIHPWARQKP